MHLNLISNDPHPQFEILDENRVLVKVRIDKLMDTLRINTEQIRRVFFITEEKLKRVLKFSLLNEYSQPLGSLVYDGGVNNSGVLEVEAKKFHFQLIAGTINEIVISNSFQKPLLTCRVSDGLISEYKFYLNYFLFALGWFAFLGADKQQHPRVAVA